MEDNGTLKWRFDVSTFRLIGRDLITDRITAIFELVKNCYDANAQKVSVKFENVGPNMDNSSITISDDGIGMSFVDIRDKWMVIGTPNKRKSPYSPKPFSRKCVGEKGIGRFAVDKLGDRLTIITKKRGEGQWLKVNIDWSSYDATNSNDSPRWFTDIESPYEYIPADNIDEQGTQLVINEIREPWDADSIRQVIRQISKMVSPFATMNYPFEVMVSAPDFRIKQKATRNIEDFDLSSISFAIDFDKESGTQQYAEYNKETQSIEIRETKIKSFGGVKISIYFFDANARRKYKQSYPNDPIDGFKIYRDGIITTPFAEEQENPDAKRDILGIDKRLWQDIFSRISSREFLGIIEITKENNPDIIDATNRQDFITNKVYDEFKRFVIEQLVALQAFRANVRKKNKEKNKTQLMGAQEELSKLTNALMLLAKRNPEINEAMSSLVQQAKSTQQAVKVAIQEQKKESEEFLRKENVYLSIMSMQEYTIQITHAIRTTLNQIKGRAEFFYRYFPLASKEKTFKLYAKEMFDKMKVLANVTDYMLSYSQSNISPEPINMRETFEDVFVTYDDLFLENKILFQADFPDKLVLNANRQFFYDILQNMIDNSIKALRNTEGQKVIKCSYLYEDNYLRIHMSDNGCGIPQEEREKIFELYYTTTEIQGGAGVGLYIVKTRVESMKGTVNVIDSEFGNQGTTFEILIPFKNHKA